MRPGRRGYSRAAGGQGGSLLTFFWSGFSTDSARLVRWLRIWAAATLVDVFSKACLSRVLAKMNGHVTMRRESSSCRSCCRE